jgi:hypothetical protein
MVSLVAAAVTAATREFSPEAALLVTVMVAADKVVLAVNAQKRSKDFVFIL